jgi:hypothetical protein
MPKVVLSIPRLGVKRGGFEKRKEIYVMSFTSDLNKSPTARIPDVIAASNETLPNVVPKIQEQALLRFVLMAVSNTFQRIQPDQPVSLSGSGILLYPNLDPKGLLASHFVVIEDDEGKRNLGKMLESLFGNSDVKQLVDVLKKGVTQPAIAALMNALVSQLPTLLKKNRDDFLFAHSHSGFDFDNYGVDSGNVANFELENDRVFCTLRVRVG